MPGWMEKGEDDVSAWSRQSTLLALFSLVSTAPLYLTAICSMLVCLRSTGAPFFRESTSGNAALIASWFDSGYVDVSLRRLLCEFTFSTFGYSDPSIDSFFSVVGNCVFRILRNAWSSVVHALRPSRNLLTRFTHFLREGGRARPVRAWNVDIISRRLYLAVNCSVSLASEHTYADF